jgi:hypothetical protein
MITPASLTMRAAMVDEISKIQDDSDTPIWGASAIGRELGLARGSVYHLLSRNLLPARRIGRRWVSTPGQLRRALVGEREVT